MKASEVLRKARSLIDRPEKWLKSDFRNVSYETATAFCAVGALIKLGNSINEEGDVRPYLDLACGDSIMAFNDLPATTHAEVMQAFDRAIALAEREELNAAPQDTAPEWEEVVAGRDHGKPAATDSRSEIPAVAAPDAAFQRFMENLTTGTHEEVTTAK